MKRMKWEEYYKNMYDWSAEIMVSKIENLEDMGSSDKITDVVYYIAIEGVAGAEMLVEKALKMGVKFSGEDMCYIATYCNEEVCKKAFYESAVSFSTQDLEDMYATIEDEWLIDVAKIYKIKLPELLEDDIEYEPEWINSVPRKKKFKYTDEEILALGLYPDDELYKMSLISRIIGKK